MGILRGVGRIIKLASKIVFIVICTIVGAVIGAILSVG